MTWFITQCLGRTQPMRVLQEQSVCEPGQYWSHTACHLLRNLEQVVPPP